MMMMMTIRFAFWHSTDSKNKKSYSFTILHFLVMRLVIGLTARIISMTTVTYYFSKQNDTAT